MPDQTPGKDDNDLAVRISKNRMRAELRIPSGFPLSMLSARRCYALFRKAGVQGTQELSYAVQDGVDKFRANSTSSIVIAVEGTPPIEGTEGLIEWSEGLDPTEDYFSKRKDHKREEAKKEAEEGEVEEAEADGDDGEEKLDFYNQTPYIFVEPGVVVAKVIKPTPGRNGCDVTGKEIPAKPGTPLPIKIDEKTITIEASTGRCVAGLSGSLSFDGRKVMVNRLLRVDGFVDFHSGNIDFDGDVEIGRGVRDRFIVKATGNIKINGLVEAATIEAGCDLQASGIAAKEKGQIRVDRNLTARYLNNVHGVVKGDAMVEREIINCHLEIGGELIVPRGSIIGGELVLVGSADLNMIGSTSEEKTLIILGSLPENEMMTEVETHLEELNVKSDEVEKKVEEMNAVLSGRTISPAQRELLQSLLFEREELDEQRERLEQKCDTLTDYLEKMRKVEVVVQKLIHAGTRVRVDNMEATFRESFRGPLMIGWNQMKQVVVTDLRSGDYEPISKVATVGLV